MKYLQPNRKLSPKEKCAIVASLKRHHQRRCAADKNAAGAVNEALAAIRNVKE